MQGEQGLVCHVAVVTSANKASRAVSFWGLLVCGAGVMLVPRGGSVLRALSAP